MAPKIEKTWVRSTFFIFDDSAPDYPVVQVASQARHANLTVPLFSPKPPTPHPSSINEYRPIWQEMWRKKSIVKISSFKLLSLVTLFSKQTETFGI